jgi:phospholipid/cholesterol/gamma-HCH transport system substrate-binding protein
MKDQRKTEIRVGITVIIGLLMIIWVFGWAKNITLSSQRKEIKVKFSSVAGLEEGDPVSINGVRKGYVEDISIKGSDVFTLLNIEKEVILRTDAKFTVMMLDLMGGKKVEIIPGHETSELDYSKTQVGEFVGDIASAMAMLGTVQNDLVDVIKEVKITLSSLNKSLTDEKFNNDLKSSVSNLVALTQNLNSLLNENKTEINNLLTNGIELTKNVNSFIQSNRDSISNTIHSVQEALKLSKDLLTRVNDLIDKTNRSENNLGKFLNDPDLMNDLKLSIGNVKELTKLLVEQLKAKGIEVNAHIF